MLTTGTGTTLSWSGDPLLTSKLSLPDVSPTLVCRQRLLDLLTDGTARPLTMITGPAGAGKTTLAASWARLAAPPGPVMWLALDPDDSAPGVFWSYVLEAFRRGLPVAPSGVEPPTGPGRVSHSLLVRLASVLEHQAAPVVLVVDALDRITGREVAADLRFLLEHAGPSLRTVLISRMDPPLPLHRYRAEGRMTEIRSADLAFTPQEATALLRRHGLAPGAAAVRALTGRTGGWAAGLKLCALAMRQCGHPDGFARSFTASRYAVADYLLAEVLDAQPPEARELLLCGSVLDRIHPDLANTLTGRDDAGQVLDRLVRVNAFAEPAGEAPWCRIHPLFAEVLRAHLRSQRPGLAPRLHRRAAHWFAGAGQVTEALRHAAEVGDWQYAADLAVRHLVVGPLLAGAGGGRAEAIFSRMPPGVPGVEAALVAGACRLARYDSDGCRTCLAEAEDHLRRTGARPGPETRLTHALLRLCSVPEGDEGNGEHAGNGEGERSVAAAEREARNVGRLLAELAHRQSTTHPELEALRLHGLARALLRAGRLDRALHALTGALDVCGADLAHGVRHRCLGLLAVAEGIRGAPDAAEEHALRSLSAADRHGLPPARRSGAAHLALASVAYARENHHAARFHLDLAASFRDVRDDPVLATESTVLRIRLGPAGGRPETAVPVLGGTGRTPVPAWLAERLAAAVAERAAGARRAAGRPDRVLRPVVPPDSPPLPPSVRAGLLRAHTALLGGDPVAARGLLLRALADARPEQLHRLFAEAGPWLGRVLEDQGTGSSRGGLGGPRDGPPVAAPRLTRRQPGGPDGLRRQDLPAVTEPLSAREREVLACLARMMSAGEIAAELHLSVNTVKSHLKNVYRKLCVSRRREAVERGRELHIL